MKIKFNLYNNLPLNKIIEIVTMEIVVRPDFHENKNYYPQIFLDWRLHKKIKSKNKLKEIDIKNCVCYYFDDIINGLKINFSNILLDKKLHKSISVSVYIPLVLQTVLITILIGW